MADRFRALVVRDRDGGYDRAIETRSVSDLPAGEVLVRVRYSALNYKDALAATGHRGVTKSYPHTPGIDAVGHVVASEVPDFEPGDRVTVTDYDLGSNTPGGWGEMIRVPADWVVHLPDGLTMRHSMGLGTAGLTAALSLREITGAGVTPRHGPVVVTGATGGVGCVSVAILAEAGYEVVAVTGKPEAKAFLEGLGATEVMDRSEMAPDPRRPLAAGRYAAAVDTVGGDILAGLLAQMLPHGVVTCCGLVASPELHTTVYPFILRGVRLIGIDCEDCPIEIRRDLWTKLAECWRFEGLEDLIRDVLLEDLDDEVLRMMEGDSRGRVVVAHASE